MKINKKRLLKEGFYEIYTNYQEFLIMGNILGEPISSRINGGIVDSLIPKMEKDAHPNSLSNIYGLNDFPFHNDGAYFHVPPRYILLRYVKGIDKPTPTLLMPFLGMLKDIDVETLKNELWLVKGRVRNFYSSIISNTISKNELVLRFDVGCMKPIRENSHILEIVKELSNRNNSYTINWKENKTVIIDNWKFLHTRPKVKLNEYNYRTLQRIMINA